jgi:hypothetical protein
MSDLTLAFEPTEQGALDKARHEIDSNHLDEPDSIDVHPAKEINYNDRWDYKDADVVYVDRRVGAWVKPDAVVRSE